MNFSKQRQTGYNYLIYNIRVTRKTIVARGVHSSLFHTSCLG